MKSVYVTSLGAAFQKKPAGIKSVRCVQASEYNRMRHANKWAEERLEKMGEFVRKAYTTNSDNRRLRKAVKWILNLPVDNGGMDNDTTMLCADRAGLRWNGKRWVEK
jgi:hypothetical protein